VSLDGEKWVRASGDLGSVEAVLLFARKHATGLFRICDVGGNVYESGDASIHIRESERRRLLEESLNG
jgi:hypothetical protein